MSHDPAHPSCRFAHLHQHTQFSLLDGAARLKDLIQWVKKVSPEEPMLAMTDHGNLFGAVQFYKYATEAGVKPIIGYEAYVAAESRFDRKQGKGLDGGYFHLTLLAKDFEGYQNLCRLASRAYLEGFYGKPRIDREILREHNAGLIVLSGCLGAEIPQFILQERHEEAERRLLEYLSIFGEKRYFIEIQDHGLPEQKKVNRVLKEFADKYGLGIVATNDGHYVRKEDAEAHAVLLAVQSKATWDDPNRWKFPCDEFYVKTPEEMRSALEGQRELWGGRFDELFDNTLEIGRMCNVELVPKKVQYRIPKYPLPEGRTEVTYFRELTFRGLLKRYPERVTAELYREFLRKIGKPVPQEGVAIGDSGGAALAKALAELEDLESTRRHLPELKEGIQWGPWEILSRAVYELTVVERMGFPGYLLIVQDFINWAKDNGISVGPGRGSAAGSLVAYATGITNIDPLAYGLLFERFLNPARVSMPDIDTDFSDVRRGEVIEYVRRRYGDEMVAQIGTFGTLASKAAIKDAARVFGLPVKKADELAKLIPVVFGKPTPLERAIETIPDLRAEMEKDPLVARVMEVAKKLEGLSRQSSVHAAGVVISDVPLTDYIPLMRAGDGEGKVTQYDMSSVEALGFLKMDFLGLRTLSFLDECRRIVKESRGIDIDYDTIPIDDEKTFELLGRGETKGIFQLDSAGMTATVRGLKPRRIQDIIALGALYRPGPMENIPTYIRRHHGREPVEYPQFPNAAKYLEPILRETYGIPVYQEQIMQIASAAAGYSLGEADLLRRCVAEGTLILNVDTGERVPVEKVEPGMRVLSLGPDYKFYRVEVQERIYNGVQPVYRLRTRSGRSLELTAEHPLLTVLGWRHLCDLKVGDAIAVPRRTYGFGSLRPDPNRVTVLAYLLGDGNTRAKTRWGEVVKANFYSSNPAMLEDFIQAVHALGARTKAYLHPRTKVSTITCRGAQRGCNPITSLVEEAGLDKRAHEKRVPQEVFAYDEESLKLFLGKLWNTDGSIEAKRISYSSSSFLLIEDLSHLLLRLGIVSMRRSRSTRCRPSHELLITDQEDVLRFAEVLGPYILSPKREALDRLAALARKKRRNQSIYAIPAAVGHKVREAKYASGVTWAQADAKVGALRGSLSSGLNLRAPNRALSRHRLRQLGVAFASEELLSLARSEVLWDVITGIEPVGEKRVYDLAVPPFANFVAEDVVIHNSMGKKKMEEMQKHREIFKKGAAGRGIPEDEADRLFDLLEAFANYGFNKSHSAAYAVLTYQTAYVKAHYPVEFHAALLTVERHDSDKVAEYIRAARAMGVEVLPPDINRSSFSFSAVGQSVLFGLSAVKNVGEAPTEAIIRERERGGRYKSLPDFLKRLDSSVANKRVVESLIKAGAFDQLGERGQMLAALDELLRWAQAERESASSGMVGLFADAQSEPTLPKIPPLDEVTQLRYEKEALGIYVTGHPLLRYEGLREAASCTIEELPDYYQSQKNGKPRLRVLLAGLVEGIVRKPTKSGGMMCKFMLGDETGAVEVVAFGRSYDKVSPRVREDAPVLVVAEVEPDGEGEVLRVMAQDVYLYDELEGLPKVMELELDLALLDDEKIHELGSLFDEYAGSVPVHLKIQSGNSWALMEVRPRVEENAKDIFAGLDWVRAKLVPDREALLAATVSGRGHNGGGEPQGPVVPF
ncbi:MULTISPECIES: DNA polymerase III subunit alpha [unclassified Meiothermus]|uniref:DNA polymerase III subunit alpha n=1 Tax=unclassified Meiothermus TaxID=370471 RepID=UPI000D7CE668|nr:MULTISPECIES: DNA polymerase III subunit alpha [unclassified Meiothermus]PZA05677.1 DNA polymerase III subunit alpha [Meiothermus sp. Pnk-1]RYM27936.1 DNA polymerase III subunit alpha [Meiothermus sp. PNK-Is4]